MELPPVVTTESIMPSAFDYREMAIECLQEADATSDAGRKKSLQDIAKLYIQTAFSMESGAQDIARERNAPTARTPS
jgi:hypothetical protein